MQAICQTQDGWKLEKRREESVDIPANIQVPSEKYETVIYSRRFDKIGKVFKLESYLGFNIDLLLDVLRVKVESYPEWNTAVKDAKVSGSHRLLTTSCCAFLNDSHLMKFQDSEANIRFAGNNLRD